MRNRVRRNLTALLAGILLSGASAATRLEASTEIAPSVDGRQDIPRRVEHEAMAPVGYNADTGVLTLDAKRTVEVVGPIMENGASIAAHIVELSNKAKAPIYLVINSPGGALSTGAYILDAMHLAHVGGSSVKCLVAGKAFSLAFNLLTACDEVYALPRAEFLFHPVRFYMQAGTPMTAFLAKRIYDELLQVELKFIPGLLKLTGLDDSTFLYHYVNETVWTASDLWAVSPFFLVVKGVENLPPSTFSWPKEGAFGLAKPKAVMSPDEVKFFVDEVMERLRLRRLWRN